MAGQLAKRKLVKRPGLFAAAEALGCTYSHLRRVVIGQRASKSLLRRFREFKKTGVATASPRKVEALNSPTAAQPATPANKTISP